MSETQCIRARDKGEGARTTRALAEWLGLAAMPTFAILALITALSDGGAMNGLCSSMSWAWLGGMTPMYLLMSAFHSPPWLKLIFGRV
jgi:hypothetical protein